MTKGRQLSHKLLFLQTHPRHLLTKTTTMASTTTAAPSARTRVPSVSSLHGAENATLTAADAITRATPVSRPADPRACAAVVSALPRSSSAGSSVGGSVARPHPSSFSPIRVVSSSGTPGGGGDAVATNLFRSPARAGGPANGPRKAAPAAVMATVSGKKRRRRNAPKFLSDFVMEEDDEFDSPDKGRKPDGESRAGTPAAAATAVVSAQKDDTTEWKPQENAVKPEEGTTMIVTSGKTAAEAAAGSNTAEKSADKSPPRPSSASAPSAPAIDPFAAGGDAIARLYSPIVVDGGPASELSSDASSRRSVARTRGELLSGVDAWFCSHCAGRRVESLTLPCGRCGRRVEFIPLDPAELRDFVKGQRERDGGRSVTEWHRRVKRMRTEDDDDKEMKSGEEATAAISDEEAKRQPATPALSSSKPPPSSAPATPAPLDLQSSVIEACENLLSIRSPDKRDCGGQHSQVTFADGDAALSFATFDPKSPGLGLLKSPGLGLLKSPGFGLGFDLIRSPGLAALLRSPGLEMSASEHELIMGSPAAPPPGLADLAGLAGAASPITGSNSKGKRVPGVKLCPARRPAVPDEEMSGPAFDVNNDGTAALGSSDGSGGAVATKSALVAAAAAAAKGLPSQVPTIHVPPRRSDRSKKEDGAASASVGKFLESMASVSLGADGPSGRKKPKKGYAYVEIGEDGLPIKQEPHKVGREAPSKRMMAKSVLVSPKLSLSASPPKRAAATAGAGEKMATATPVDSQTPTTKFDLIKSRSRERAARKRTAAVAAAVSAARQQAAFGSPGDNEEDGDEYVDDAIRDDEEDDDWSPTNGSPANAKPAKKSHRKKRPSSDPVAIVAGQNQAEEGTSEPPSAPTKRARGRPRKPEAVSGATPGRGKPSRSPKIPKKSKAPAPAGPPKRKYLRKGELEEEEELARNSVPQLKGDEESFTLYHPDDDKYINELHTIIRRDIWEGFVVDDGEDGADSAGQNGGNGRLSCYVGTVGFRCRWCRDVDPSLRAEKSAVYPRELERIYHANIRFQRDHVP